jgi:LacI family transcriptional regulator
MSDEKRPDRLTDVPPGDRDELPGAARPRQVLIAVPTAASWGQRIVQGATDYARRQGPAWELLFQAGEMDDPGRVLRFAAAQGVILHPQQPHWIEHARGLSCPVVLVGESAHLAPDWPCVSEDNPAVGRLAHRHLADKGFRRFGFWGLPGEVYSDKRERGFFDAAAEAGHAIFVQPGSRYAGGADESGPGETPTGAAALEAWLANLPRPAALLLADCNLAAQAAWACRSLSIRLPEEMALLSVNNDELLCEITTPPLSSIEQNCRQIGYEAARRVDAILDGRDDAPRVQLVEPRAVIERQSTESLAVDDEQTAEALRFIRRRALEGISPQDVLDRVAAARTSLEQRFKQTIGRTIFQEILRVRLQHARRLLAETDWKIATIAERCGFASASYFTTAFGKALGVSPSEYRRRHR